MSEAPTVVKTPGNRYSKQKKAQELAHRVAGPKGVNPRWDPEDYGEELEKSWYQITASLAPSSLDDFHEKMEKVMEKAWEKAEKEDISLAKAMSWAQEKFGLATPSTGPPPPVVQSSESGKAPSQTGAGYEGSIAGSPEAKEALTLAGKYRDEGMDKKEALQKAWDEIRG